MSVAVDLDNLRQEAAKFGSTPYLLTVSPDGRPHAVHIPVEWDGDDIVGAAGRRTGSNVTAQRAVTLLWPPTEPGGYSLIVDGDATLAGEQVRVTPVKALLHRPAAGATVNACGHDCVPVFER
jgi:hypothetical protein